MMTPFKSRIRRDRLVGDATPEIEAIKARFADCGTLCPDDISYLQGALNIQRHQARIIAFLLDLPSKPFREVARGVDEPLTGLKPGPACAFFRRVIGEGILLPRRIASHYVAPAARIGDPAFLDSLMQRAYGDGLSMFGAGVVLDAVMGARDPGSGRILAGWVEAYPKTFLESLNLHVSEHKTNPKAPMALMIAGDGEIPEKLRARLAETMARHHEYTPLFHAGAHAMLARKAYAARWDLADFIGKPLRDIRAADAAHNAA